MDIAIAGGDTARPLNLRKRLDLVRRWLPAGPVTLLDCGCGGGAYVRALRAELGVSALGVEYLEEKIALVRGDGAVRGLVCRGDVSRLPFASGAFDAALLNEVIEHVPDEVAALREINRVLRPGGVLVVLAPNRWFPFETHGVILRRGGALLPPSVPFVPYVPLPVGRLIFRYWARNYWPRQLRRLVERCDFDVVAWEALWQTFENISGRQSRVVTWARAPLRGVSAWCERTALIRALGASQVVVARKRS